MLAQRRRRWANINPALGQHLVFIRTVSVSGTETAKIIDIFTVYCRSGNIRKVLIFANFAKKTNSPMQESCNFFYYNSATNENENSRVLNFVKSPRIKKIRKY